MVALMIIVIRPVGRITAGRPLNVPVIRSTGHLTSSLSGRSQWYLFSANPNPNQNANPTNPTTKYRCEGRHLRISYKLHHLNSSTTSVLIMRLLYYY